MSKLILFNKLDFRIIDKVSDITQVQLWNNQLVHEENEEARAYPRCYIEFVQMEWLELAKSLQEGDVIIRVRTVIERYQTDDRTFLTLVDEVFTALQFYSELEFSPLNRISETQDIDHDNCIVWITDFKTRLLDCQADEDRDKTDIAPISIQLDTDLDIDNDTIRTGDGII